MVANNAFGDGEVATTGATGTDGINFALDDDFARAHSGNGAGAGIIFVVTREGIEKITQGFNTGLL